MGGSHGKPTKKKQCAVPRRRSLLLLGTAGVGKTTIVKQLTTSLGSGLSDANKLHLTKALRKSCAQRIHDIIDYSVGGEFETTLEFHDEEGLLEKVEQSGLTLERGTAEEISSMGENLAKVWSHDLVREIVTNHHITTDHDRQLLHASADMFLPDVKRVFAADFVLTDQEALQVRCPTTGVETTTFCYNKEDWSVKDVGGQIYERCSWRASFEGVSMILYIVSLADYAKFAGKKNVLMENRALFKEVCQCDALVGMPFILLFNKIDVFEQKLKSTPFNVCPQFKNLERDLAETDAEYLDRCTKALFKYYRKAYKDVLDGQKEKKGEKKLDKIPIEYFTTCATDPEFISKSMASVMTSIKNRLKAFLTGESNLC